MSTPKSRYPQATRTDSTPPAGEPPTFRLDLRVPVAVPDRAWTARLEGVTPEGHPLRPREFQSLGDLTAFVEGLVTGRGLR